MMINVLSKLLQKVINRNLAEKDLKRKKNEKLVLIFRRHAVISIGQQTISPCNKIHLGQKFKML